MTTIGYLSLSGSAMALLLLALRRILGKRLPSGAAYYAWLLVLLRFLLPLPGLVPVGRSAAPAETQAASALQAPMLEEESELTWTPVTADLTAADRPADPLAAAELPVPEEEEYAEEAVSHLTVLKPRIDWRSPRLWMSLWGAGALLSFLWPLFSYLRFTAALRRRGKKPGAELRRLYREIPGRKPVLLVCPGLQTPLMYGVFAPRIVLPAELSDPALLGSVLRHELTHYRRLDPLYKWFAAAVLSLHWFNPLSWLIRRELNRDCELSCDEALLRSMDRAEKQAYGETLLRMAAGSALPAGVVATTFSTEKKDLKERLEQIMHYKKKKGRALAALLALLLLCGCGAAAGPAGEPVPEDSPREEDGLPPVPSPLDGTVVEVSDVDGLLAAIAPNTTIVLAPGEYDFSTAHNYGGSSDSPWYSWSLVAKDESGTPGYELQIRNAEGLTLRGSGEGETVLAAVPRYANVILFQNCPDLRIEQLTAGHTRLPGYCMGGVLRLEACNRATVDACGLYGCGTIGVHAQDCTELCVSNCHIYECSYGAVNLQSCRKVQIQGCEVERNGVRPDSGAAYTLFSVNSSDSVIVSECRVHGNDAQRLLHGSYTKNLLFLSNTVEKNRFLTSLFRMDQYAATVDGCAFPDNEAIVWIEGAVCPADAEGQGLDAAALQAMEYRWIDPNTVKAALPAAAALELPPGESVTVTTVDEFLAAIGPERSILLDGELFDLSQASNYGGVGGEYYYWKANYDGPELVISGVSGLTIRAAGDDPEATTLAAVPRYADVLAFQDCQRISLVGFTAGHTKLPGVCSGGVLQFNNCSEISLEACRLYGCGILGLSCDFCNTILVRDCEIFECTQGGVHMSNTDGVRFLHCRIRDVPSPALSFYNCGDKSWNDEPFQGDSFDVADDGSLRELSSAGGGGEIALVNALYPLGLFDPGPFRDWMLPFLREAQTALAERDWETLSGMLNYPFTILTAHESYGVPDASAFLQLDLDRLLTRELRAEIAADPLTSCGICTLGNTACGGHLAFARIRASDTNPTGLLLTCLSVDEPLEDDRAPDKLGVYFYGLEKSEFTLEPGEQVTLDAILTPLGLFPEAEFSWTVSDPEALGFSVGGDNFGRITLEARKPAPGGVAVQVRWRDNITNITVYIREG